MLTLNTPRPEIRSFILDDLPAVHQMLDLDHGFEHLHLRRIVAMTRYDNTASIGVTRKLGMRIEHNLLQDPPWLQVVGLLEKR